MISKQQGVLVGLTFFLASAIALTYGVNKEHVPLKPDLTIVMGTTCDLNQGACSVPLPNDGSLTLSIGPTPIHPVVSLNFSVQAKGAEVTKVLADLKGISMNMGINRVDFTEVDVGVFKAESNLPVCIRSRMQWQADLWVKTKDHGIILATYTFIATKR